MDYAALLYDPIYNAFGVPAVLTLPNTSADAFDLTVIDKTAGVTVSEGALDVQSIRPAAAVRMVELAEQGITVDDLDGSDITFNGKTWNVRNHRLVPSPEGEAKGEVYLILSEF